MVGALEFRSEGRCFDWRPRNFASHTSLHPGRYRVPVNPDFPQLSVNWVPTMEP